MKTAGSAIAKMQFAFTLLLASLAVQSLARPLAPLWDKEVRQERNTQLLHRSKRFTAVQSDYSTEAFLSRSSWRSSSCDAMYNCAPVNPSHCSNDSVNFFILDEVNTNTVGCQMNFTVLVEEGGTTEGAELALYKKTEPDTNSHLRYYVYVVYKKLSETHYSKVLGERLIDSSCNSWQVFNIGGIKDDLPEGVHKFNLLVAVFKETEINQPQPLPILNCSEVKSLFVMDTAADIKKFKGINEKPKNETPTEIDEFEVDGNDKNENENENNATAALDSNNKIEELDSGSGAGKDLVVTRTKATTPPPLIVEEDKVEEYLPTVAVFVRGGPNPLLRKRSTGESTKTDIDPDKEADPATNVVVEEQMEENDESSGANCRLLENKVDLQALDPDIIRPTIEDIGKCSNSTDTVECRPTAFRNLEVLLKRTGDIQFPSLEIRHDYIITECTPFAKTQPSMDDLTSSGSTPLRRKRFIDETPKAEDSKTNKLKDAVIETDTDKKDGEESSNTNCRLLENKISLSTVNPNIIEPKILDIGKCSGSTDIMECRPTGFQHLQVILKTNGSVSLNTLQNFITTECTPFFNTQSIPSA